jgi:hypothetical protein
MIVQASAIVSISVGAQWVQAAATLGPSPENLTGIVRGLLTMQAEQRDANDTSTIYYAQAAAYAPGSMAPKGTCMFQARRSGPGQDLDVRGAYFPVGGAAPIFDPAIFAGPAQPLASNETGDPLDRLQPLNPGSAPASGPGLWTYQYEVPGGAQVVQQNVGDARAPAVDRSYVTAAQQTIAQRRAAYCVWRYRDSATGADRAMVYEGSQDTGDAGDSWTRRDPASITWTYYVFPTHEWRDRRAIGTVRGDQTDDADAGVRAQYGSLRSNPDAGFDMGQGGESARLLAERTTMDEYVGHPALPSSVWVIAEPRALEGEGGVGDPSALENTGSVIVALGGPLTPAEIAALGLAGITGAAPEQGGSGSAAPAGAVSSILGTGRYTTLTSLDWTFWQGSTDTGDIVIDLRDVVQQLPRLPSPGPGAPMPRQGPPTAPAPPSTSPPGGDTGDVLFRLDGARTVSAAAPLPSRRRLPGVV